MHCQLRGITLAALLTLVGLLIGCKRGTDSSGGQGEKPDDDVVVTEPDPDEPRGPYSYSGHDAEYLEQGWDDNERYEFYYLGQGSQLVPYDWFVCLELPDSDDLLKSDRHMASLGYITQRPGDRNPDGLPIGFVKDSNPSSIAIKAAFLGDDYNAEHFPKQENDWLGLTCAACHTADLTYKGKVIRIDGGAAMADVESFLGVLAASMRATVADDAKYAAFDDRIRERGGAGAAPTREELDSYTKVIENLVARNKTQHPYGLARLDAFGAILNQVTETALEMPENRRPSSAPVSYPFLWDAPHLDWVQWNSSAEIPIARNVGEVLGVFAHFELTDNPDTGYASSARLDYLHRLEVSLRSLTAPPWPADHFGEIDAEKAAKGKELFAVNCANCHNARDDDGNFRMTQPNPIGNRFIKTTSVPFNVIGTDPLMIVNFATRTAKPGVLADAVAAEMEKLEASGGLERLNQIRAGIGLPAADFTQEVPAGLLLGGAVRGVIQRYLGDNFQNLNPQQIEQIMLDLRGGRPTDSPRPNGGIGYKARPLNGVWATAPYLHNGSVPNLWELLKPQEERVTSFYVGSREFDPTHVGLSTEQVEGAFHFKTVSDDNSPIPGNSNQGHSGNGYTSFSDEERWALIEYIKTLE